MISISKKWTFDSAHQLHLDDCSAEENKARFGKCNRPHGHTYTLEVAVRGRVHDDTGMVLNYFELDKIVKPLVERLDHQDLNQIFEFLTTSENMVVTIGQIIHDALPNGIDIHYVTLSETPKTTATWQP